ncbi:MAG: HupE/UreJ family protein [Myxococcota bacterium]
MTARSLIFIALASVFAGSTSAQAHEVGLSRGGYHFDGTEVSAELRIQSQEAGRAGLAPVGRGEADALADTVWHVTASGARCTPSAFEVRTDPDVNDGALVTASWRCPTESALALVEFVRFGTLSNGHRHLAHLDRDARTLTVLSEGEATMRVPRSADPRSKSMTPGGAGDKAAAGTDPPKTQAPPASETAPDPAPAAESASGWSIFASMIAMGVEHILMGFDHLLFLLGLLLICGRISDMAKVITAFTVAHSVTLCLAALDVWTPPAGIIEPAIALSVAFVGIENFIKPDPAGRWRIAGAFGFIHGFGFAGALGEVGLPEGNVVAALAGFNIGVELGQLAIMVLVVPIIAMALKRPTYTRYVMPALSGLVALAGILWFAERVVS